MDDASFKRIVAAFADTPTDIDLSKGRLLLQVRDDLVEAQVSRRPTGLVVEESGEQWPAEVWVINRLARLPVLAERISSLIPIETHFVTPSGRFLDQMERRPDESVVDAPDALECLGTALERRPAGTSSVLYLTSDAGEGKTTTIHQLARRQAQRYRDKQTDWLLVPISLGGRTFLRFDDVVVGALVNKLRFPLLYFNAFVELVRLGALVPALDGFEEMFVESAAGDAISALGSLMQTLQSSGSVLIAARSAYFEYKSLETQARLYDALAGQSVAFARLSLHRWTLPNFLDYAARRGVSNGQEIYDTVSDHIGADHPLLTRAVLVRRLLDIAGDGQDMAELLPRLQRAPGDYFAQFVGAIMSREAKEKWIDRSLDPAQPLLTEREHEELLSMVAQEMWLTQADSLGADLVDLTAELYCDAAAKAPHAKRQVVERLKQHALLAAGREGKDRFTFDHEEFFHFFLGVAVARAITEGRTTDTRYLLSRGALPGLALDTAGFFIGARGPEAASGIVLLNGICETESSGSFVRENAGALAIRGIDRAGVGVPLVKSMVFPPGSFEGRKLGGVTFQDCYVYRSGVAAGALAGCTFANCTIEELELGGEKALEAVEFVESSVGALVPAEDEHTVFDPAQIRMLLRLSGAKVAEPRGLEVPAQVPQKKGPPSQDEQKLMLAEKVFVKFLRATHINENTLRQNLGARATSFLDDVLPGLKRAGVIEEIPYLGSGKQRRFRLGMSLRKINAALPKAGGSFERFLEAAQGKV